MSVTITTSKVPAFLDAIVWRLGLRGELEGVTVSSGPLGPDPNDTIEFVDVDAPQDWGALGNRRREEEAVFRGFIWFQNKMADSNEAGIRFVRQRVYEVLAVIEDELRHYPDVRGEDGEATCRAAHLTDHSLDQGVNDKGRWASIRFEITAKASLATS